MKNKPKNPEKVGLENLIFYCAAATGGKIYFFHGKLLTEARGLLGFLASVYNRLFEAENKAFLAQDWAEQQKSKALFWQEYLAEKKKNPTADGFSLGIKNPR